MVATKCGIFSVSLPEWDMARVFLLLAGSVYTYVGGSSAAGALEFKLNGNRWRGIRASSVGQCRDTFISSSRLDQIGFVAYPLLQLFRCSTRTHTSRINLLI